MPEDPANNPWAEHIGKRDISIETVNRKDLTGLASLLDYPITVRNGRLQLPWDEHDAPPFAHWLNANPLAAHCDRGADGHPAQGGFFPDFPFPRRMWAGSRVRLLSPYGVDQPLQHQRELAAIQPKSGRSGDMIFVTVVHEFRCEGKVVVREEQDIVYRNASTAAVTAPGVKPGAEIMAAFEYDWCNTITPDPLMLFQYSAVTHNGHRIHYDRNYAITQENYPALVVQGPLTATCLLDLYLKNNPGSRVESFSFRGLSPLYDLADCYMMGSGDSNSAELWAVGPDGNRAMTLSVSAADLQAEQHNE